MGTVGLSFGSPTSGQGFDVSSTVASIVSNLQNVETPWKGQVTTLESQDTAISSLGTLFSNLSNDLSSLTDLQGTLAEKTGASSNTNVLELTSASTAATAGTHSVVVNSLAQNSSGYLAEISNAADKLSGSVTLQVGSGKTQTITLSSSDNTLSGLASAINSSGVGISASMLTDASGSRLSLVSGTSGAGGDIIISSNTLTAAVSNTLSATVTAGSSGTPSTALFPAALPSDSLSSSTSDGLSDALSVTVGTNGAAQTISLSDVKTATGGTTVADIADYINQYSEYNSGSTLGFTAQAVENSDGTYSLELTSLTSGTAGTLSVNSNLVDSTTALNYTQTVTGQNASLTVDGVNLTSTSNIVTNLIPGLTFQLLSTSPEQTDNSLEPIQVVIGNDNTDVESTVNQMVSDYNSLISAVNTQEGNTSSGTAEPLFGSPTLSLLQQQLLSGLNAVNPYGYLTPVADIAGTTVSGSMQISLANGMSETIVTGAGISRGGTFYTGSGSDNNTLGGLVAAINTAAANTPLTYTGSSTDPTTGTITVANSSPLSGAAPTLNGQLIFEVGNGTTESVSMDDVDSIEGGTTLSDLKTYINANSSTLGIAATVTDNGNGTSTLSLTTSSSTDSSLSGGPLTVNSDLVIPGSGVTAAVTTSNGESSLTLINSTSGSAGAMSVTTNLTASTPKALSYSDLGGYTTTTADSGTLGEAGASDLLIGSVTFRAGSGMAATVTMDQVQASEGGTTLADLASYINSNFSSSVSATPVKNSDGSVSLSLTSQTVGLAGALTVTSNLNDSSNSTASTLDYTNSSDIDSLISLGIGVNNDGSLTLDVSSLDSALNSDFNSVVGFFQNVDSWGQSFSSMLTNAGTSSPTGILNLAQSSNSSTESTLNAEITKENALISTEQTSLTAELNSANEIMQELPSQLDGINELYSAITGYNQGANG